MVLIYDRPHYYTSTLGFLFSAPVLYLDAFFSAPDSQRCGPWQAFRLTSFCLTKPLFPCSLPFDWRVLISNTFKKPSSIIILIVSITKFVTVIGSPHTYLSSNWRAITWVSNYRCPIWTFCNWILVIGYLIVDGFLRNVFYSFQDLGKALQTFSLKRNSQNTFLIPKFVIDTIKVIP